VYISVKNNTNLKNYILSIYTVWGFLSLNSMVINCNSLHETLLRTRQKCLSVNGEYVERIYGIYA
jgi:hypothetical protein